MLVSFSIVLANKLVKQYLDCVGDLNVLSDQETGMGIWEKITHIYKLKSISLSPTQTYRDTMHLVYPSIPPQSQ